MTTFESINKNLKSVPIAEFTVTSLGDFCSHVECITEVWRRTVADRQLRLDQPAPFNYGELSPWFRGLSNSDYACEPSLFRFHEELREFQGVDKPTIYEMEEYFFQRFKAFGPPLFEDSIPKSKLEWNFLMRNHGVPSRLLDWSKGSFIALYFATRHSFLKLKNSNLESNKSNVTSSVVWMLEPRRLNEISGHMRDLFRGSYEKFSEEYFPELVDTRSVNKLYPLPLIPNLISSRIRAHIGRFTLHPFKEGGLIRFADDAFRSDKTHGNQVAYLVKIIIPTEYHFKICRSLRSTGISDMNFTQDLDGLINELKLRVILGREDHNKFAKEKENLMGQDIGFAQHSTVDLDDGDSQDASREASQISARNQIFISYSHKDQEWLNDLKTHLKPYIRINRQLAVWEDTQIQPGAEWREAINQAIASAKIAVLLVSPDFLASEFIDAEELPPLLEAASNRELTIYWIPVRSSSYKQTRIMHYQAAYRPEQPLDSLEPAARDRAWVEICETLNEAFKDNSGSKK